MKVKELKQLLQDLPDDMEVILQCDPDNYYYSVLNWGEINFANTDPGGHVYDVYPIDDEVCGLIYTAEDVGMSENQWEDFKKNTPCCFVLYPSD